MPLFAPAAGFRATRHGEAQEGLQSQLRPVIFEYLEKLTA
jgi:hypothetical protein